MKIWKVQKFDREKTKNIFNFFLIFVVGSNGDSFKKNFLYIHDETQKPERKETETFHLAHCACNHKYRQMRKF